MPTKNRVYEEVDPNAETWTEDIDVKLSNLCACEKTLPLQLNPSETCKRFCSGAQSEAAIYLDAQLNQEVLSRVGLTTLYEWCTKDRTDEFGEVETTNSGCVLRAKDSSTNVSQDLAVEVAVSSNKLVAKLPEGFRNNINYQLILVESSSESISDSVQFLKIDPLSAVNFSPINITGTHKYECNVTYLNEDNTLPPENFNYGKSFYFSISDPGYLTAKFSQDNYIVCHEGSLNDAAGVTRLGLRLNEFPLFHPSDPKFWDFEEDGIPAIQDLIEAKTGESYGVDGLFTPLTYKKNPMMLEDDQEDILGYVFNPILENNIAKCLDFDDYNSSDLLYQTLGQIFKNNNQQYPLEPIYQAVRLPLNFVDQMNVAYDEPEFYGEDKIYVRRSQINTGLDRWYTLQNGTKVPLDSDGSLPNGDALNSNVNVYFQVDSVVNPRALPIIYEIRSPGGEGSISPYNDKRYGCVPLI